MNLSKRLAGEFTRDIRQRGEAYFSQRRVRITDGSSDFVEAEVRGSDTYDVSLQYEHGVLAIECDCPYYRDNLECKHAWAAILAADARGYLSDAAAAPNLILETMDSGEEEFGDDYDDDFPSYFAPSRKSGRAAIPKLPPPPPLWKTRLSSIADCQRRLDTAEAWPVKKEILYAVDVPNSISSGCLVLWLGTRNRKADGNWGKVSALAVRPHEIERLPVSEDRELISAIAGGVGYYGYAPSVNYVQNHASFIVTHPLATSIMRMATRTGRCYLRNSADQNHLTPLEWDDAGTWQFELEMLRAGDKTWKLQGTLRRGDECLELSKVLLITKGGLVFTQGHAAPLAEDTPFEWVAQLRKQGPIEALDKDKDEMLGALLCSPCLPNLRVPDELQYEDVPATPRPALKVVNPERSMTGKLHADLSFDYNGRLVGQTDPERGFYDPTSRKLMRRDSNSEAAAVELLNDLGLKYSTYSYGYLKPHWELAPTKLPRTVQTLLEAGWHIEADGKMFRRPGGFKIEVSSGVDWFELRGAVEYGETSAKLPELLEALKKGDKMVRLGDGTYGMLPEEWMGRLGMLAGLGTPQNGHVRFRPSQAGLLDALLATQPEASCDDTFARVREELRSFEGVDAARQPDGFKGHLRDYQREGLGWMDFLRRFFFGGCLADDMGVGKTAQVLALLETRRELKASGETIGPSLVVVPRSLVFNWKEEAARFTPQLRVLDYTGLSRNGQNFNDYDLVISTYGTLRRDAARIKDIHFDYVVLDEAQAIKNSGTESSKAVRLLRGAHRLALSGTPIENHLGELWSLFEFLNPGMLGAASVFKLSGGRNPDEGTRRLLSHALRPFILRRTKQQVASELPAKTEQTVHCELDPPQRKLYNELRQHYRDSLLKRIETDGLAKSKMHVLEALLRLRQAACHPGLLDPKRRNEGSAKLDTLLEQLHEVMDAGHKALVFSQFTTLLGIVRNRLDTKKISYEYLDGQTRNRQACVERFQNDKDCKLFLVSLKAGGLGLNLTAAEYVFLLDPWWNPAVEAQAVDRAHRIGQDKQVFAYRLIASDTVEEKVLELQKSKRDLAAAIITEDNSVLASLKREDLEMLLS